MNFRQNGDKYLITIEVIALIVVLVFGAVHFVMPGNNANKKITESQQETQNPTQET
ncbi:MAG TPA: beta-glucosidase, partial [Eubacterium sp.]|nr:beta-glucosidase [Eubacterium sp.]